MNDNNRYLVRTTTHDYAEVLKDLRNELETIPPDIIAEAKRFAQFMFTTFGYDNRERRLDGYRRLMQTTQKNYYESMSIFYSFRFCAKAESVYHNDTAYSADLRIKIVHPLGDKEVVVPFKERRRK